jgi:hypothetical protein
MKRVMILLAVATVTAQSVGCCCTRCCPWRSWYHQGDYCATQPANPCCPTPVAASPCCPTPMATSAPCCPQQAPQYAYGMPQSAPMMAPMMAQPAMAYAMEANCAAPMMGQAVYDASWMPQEASCGCPGMGMGGEMMMQSPDGVVYPGPAE